MGNWNSGMTHKALQNCESIVNPKHVPAIVTEAVQWFSADKVE